MNETTGEEDTNFGLFEGVANAQRSSGCTSESGFPRRPFVPPLQDPYSSSLNCSPRRHIPVGQDHQASIPIWKGNTSEKKIERTETLESKAVEISAEEKRLMGTCILPMLDPELPVPEDDGIGRGREECFCMDAGSIRCVRQHVREQQERLKESIGDKIFVKLGFDQMGEEEVSRDWSEEEELDFHEVVYSNPASLGRDFWSRLSAFFPGRSKKDIVSYYFNVFMLRKRASQNRSWSLDIDSDDDEWHGISRGNSLAIRDSDDEDDSAIESLDDQLPRDEGSGGRDEREDSEDSDGSDDGDDGGAVKNYGAVHQASKSTIKGREFDRFDGISGHFQEDCVFQDDSCTSFECQVNMADSCGQLKRLSGIRTENDEKSSDTKPGLVDQLYLSDSLDSKVWDSRFNVSRPEKSFDLLPWDMIEDIFGDGKDDGKTKDN